MGHKSAIEWTDASWTPIRARHLKTGKVGWHCEHDTPGCEHCYSETMNERFGTGLPFKPGHRKDIEIFLDGIMLTQPLRWKKPRMVFVCSMTDLFARFVPDEWIDKIFAVMALCPQHTFQVLTKRSARMRTYFAARMTGDPWAEAADDIADLQGLEDHPIVLEPRHMPLPNVWLGVSCEDQARADGRIPDLLATPAAVRFVSAEPLLGPIKVPGIRSQLSKDSLAPDTRHPPPGIDWIIVGGESGPGHRVMDLRWADSIMGQCDDANIPFFFKQDSGPRSGMRGRANDTLWLSKEFPK